MSSTTADRRPAGDVLDEVFAELDAIKAELAPWESEENAINYTPSGRFRVKLSEKQTRRLEEIEDETRELRARQAELTKQACQVVAQAGGDDASA